MVGRMKLVRRAVTTAGTLACAATVLMGGLAGSASAAESVTCDTYTNIPVALAQGQPASYTIAGELCATPSELTDGQTVQLLVHGATYNHTYWDFGTIDGVQYSYARDIAAAGYATFAIDEIGAGQSSHPPSTEVTIQAAAFVMHQAVQDLLHGTINGTRFGRVLAVGHSQGSATVWLEASTFHDIAGAIITSFEHDLTMFTATLPPFVSAPPSSGLDPGYVTSAPGTRGARFYNTADADPNVIAQDEATKDYVSLTEATGAIALINEPQVTQAINVPVLLIDGGDDQLFCGPETDGATFSCASGQILHNEEAPDYSAAARLRACIVPNSGHDLNLALNHDIEETDALAWANDYIGPSGTPTSSNHALPADCNS